MIAKHKVLKAIEDVKQLSTTTGLTDEQIIWVKDKVAQIEAWKDIAVAKFTDIEVRVSALENKVALAQQKFNQIDNKIAAIEARLTAHGI